MALTKISKYWQKPTGQSLMPADLESLAKKAALEVLPALQQTVWQVSYQGGAFNFYLPHGALTVALTLKKEAIIKALKKTINPNQPIELKFKTRRLA